MSNLTYPNVKDYILPKGNVLVISCMDLRLTDNLLNFLHFDNLQNRFDHFILAGASLFCSEEKNLFGKDEDGIPFFDKYNYWKKALYDHLDLATNLHEIKDVYIVEHQDCGAYNKLLNRKKVDLSDLKNELKWHKKFSEELAGSIVKKYKKYEVNVHTFFIDIRGNVELLGTFPSKKEKNNRD